MIREKTPIPTQMLDLRSVDFGPKQEQPGRRIKRLAPPPPTGLIQPDMMLRDDREVIAEVRAERRSASHLAYSAKRTFRSTARALLDAGLDRLPPVGNRFLLALLGVRDLFAEGWSSCRGWIAEKRGATFGRVRAVTRGTVLRVRAARDGRVAVHVSGGTKVLVYPEHGARTGWVLARTVDGEVGFVEKKFLT